MTTRHILAAYDLSALSDRAVERAFRLAADMQANLTILHVVEEGVPGNARDKAYAQMESMMSCLTERTKVTAKCRVENGNAVEVILSYAIQEKADLIVVGIHKKESIADWFTNSTAERLIRKSTFPILTVQDKPVESYKRLLAAVDFSMCSRKALQTALVIAPEAMVCAAHIYDFPFPALIGLADREKDIKAEVLYGVRQEAATDMRHFLAPFGKDVVEILEHGDVRYKLEDVVKQIQPDLLAIGTHGRSGFVTMLIGSVALAFLNNPPCDILITKGY